MGLRSAVLKIPAVFDVFTNGIVQPHLRTWLSDEVIDARDGHAVLDVGCGTATILSLLPDIRYVGIDHNPRYIMKARDEYGSRGEFLALDVNDKAFDQLGEFDRVLLLGVLHHLSDVECKKLLSQLASSLKPGGHLTTFDNALVKGQHPLARLLAKADRGRFARSPEEYRELIETAFDVESEIVRHDLLRVPYTHVIFRAVKKAGAATTQ
jgi:SAM-dependent methyltransferase